MSDQVLEGGQEGTVEEAVLKGNQNYPIVVLLKEAPEDLC